MEELLSQVSPIGAVAFEYERFLAQRSWIPHLFLEWIATASRAGISLAVGAGLIVIYLYLRAVLLGFNLNAYEVWLLVINCVMLIGDLTIAFFTGRIRYNYLSQQDYYRKARVPDPGSGSRAA
jgi:hypothetical protein